MCAIFRRTWRNMRLSRTCSRRLLQLGLHSLPLGDRPQLNFLAINTQVSVFLFGVDRGADKKTGLFIAEHLKTAINMVGSDNVVGVLMDGASNCVSAVNIIKEEFPKIQYIRCAAHSLNNLMKDIGARPCAVKTIEDAQGIISTLKNSHWVTGKLQEQNSLVLLKPASTRFGTNFIAKCGRCWIGW
ncbi:unnamed protein product [Closterium sp. Yama58-4]|nr:unnamed protein product [Closterium sp. Yama58-4]